MNGSMKVVSQEDGTDLDPTGRKLMAGAGGERMRRLWGEGGGDEDGTDLGCKLSVEAGGERRESRVCGCVGGGGPATFQACVAG